jgi:hypothetical protein
MQNYLKQLTQRFHARESFVLGVGVAARASCTVDVVGQAVPPNSRAGCGFFGPWEFLAITCSS